MVESVFLSQTVVTRSLPRSAVTVRARGRLSVAPDSASQCDRTGTASLSFLTRSWLLLCLRVPLLLPPVLASWINAFRGA